MKKLVSLLALICIFNSCSPGDDNNYTFELLPIESVDIPAEFVLGQTYPITVHYTLPTSCHFFNTLYYDKNLNVRTIAVESGVVTKKNCTDTPQTAEYTFNFQVTSNGGSYIFKFYKGKNDTGEDLFLEYEVPVTN